MLIAAQHGQGQVKRCDVGNNKINALVYRSSHRAQSLTVCMWLVVCCSSTANKSFPNVYGTEQSPKMPARPFPPPTPHPPFNSLQHAERMPKKNLFVSKRQNSSPCGYLDAETCPLRTCTPFCILAESVETCHVPG